MGSSGLIFVVIVAAWALFLVPSWLQRRGAAVDPIALAAEADDDERAALGLYPAPRTRAHARVLVRPGGGGGSAPGGWSQRLVAVTARRRSEEPHSRTAAQRRRRVLLVLTGATVLVAAATAVSTFFVPRVVSWWWTAVPAGLLVGYLALLAITRPGARAATAPRMARAPAEPPTVEEAHQAAPGFDDDASLLDDRSAGAAIDGDPGATSEPNPLEAAYEAELAAVRSAADDAASGSDTVEGTWTPTPVPLPSYVTAPKAPRRIRTIDLSAPGSWAAGEGRPAADQGEAAAEAPRPRAVGD